MISRLQWLPASNIVTCVWQLEDFQAELRRQMELLPERNPRAAYNGSIQGRAQRKCDAK